MKKLYIALCFFTLASCKKLLFDAPVSTDYTTTFESLWQRVHEHYCCFDIAEVDWNEVYADYAPQVSNDMTEASFIELIDEMLSILKDHNLSVRGPSLDIRYSEYELHPANLDTNTVRLYNPTGQPYVAYDSVAYINRFNDGYSFYDQNTGISYSIDLFEGAINRARNKNLKGIILDFRSLLPPSGRPYNRITINPYDFIRIGEQRPVGVSRQKSGPAPDDFEETNLEETRDGSGYEGPIIVLINYQMFTNNNYDAFRTAELSNTILMGTSIGSGHSGISTSILPNGWLLDVPQTAIFDVQGNSIGLGIQPDTVVLDDTATTDIDEVIEAAIDMLR